MNHILFHLKKYLILFDHNNVHGWDGAESCENHGQKDEASWLAVPNTLYIMRSRWELIKLVQCRNLAHTVGRMKCRDDVAIFPAGLEEADSLIGKSGLKGARRTGWSGEKHHLQHEGYTFNLRYSAGWNINEALWSSLPKDDQGYVQVS